MSKYKTLQPKIYVACLAAYNAGYLHGKWIDADQGVDAIYEEIYQMLATSPIANAEEWAIHDYEDFSNIKLEEYADIETVAEIANFITEYEELGAAVISHTGSDNLFEAYRLIEECCYGEFENEAAFVQIWIEETTKILEIIVYYIDYDQMAHDWFNNDFFYLEINCTKHAFSEY